MNRVELAWLAGILEGEGYFSLTLNNKTKDRPGRHYARLTVTMTDKDVIECIYAITGFGTIHTYPPYQPNRKRTYTWRVSKWEDLYPLLRRLRPFMGERRRARIDEMLTFERENPRKGRGRWRQDATQPRAGWPLGA